MQTAKSKSLVSPAQTISIGAYRLSYRVVYSKRKTVQLVLKSADYLEIKAPFNVDAGVLAQMVAKRQNWLLKHIAELEKHPYAAKPCFADGSTHFLLGKPYTLQLKEASAKRFSCFQNRFLVSAPADRLNAAEELLYKFYTKEAKLYFNQKLNELWPVFCAKLNALYPNEKWPGRPIPKLTVRRMKSRFGSMSALNKMTLNTELIRTAPRYIEYVMWHELCHLKHMDHSPNYYALLVQFAPQWRTLKHELQRLLPLH